MNGRRLYVFILPLFALILVSCNLPAGNPAATLLAPTKTPTPTPNPQSLTPTPKKGKPAVSPTPSETPVTPTVTPQAGTYSINLIYSQDTKDTKFEYTESMMITGTFTLANDGSQEGTGAGIYSQGLKSLNPAFDCGFPVTANVTMDIKGITDKTGSPLLFHQYIVVKFQPLIATEIKCEAIAAKMTISIPLSGTTEVLDQRAATFPWSDYKINPVLGLYSTLMDGEGIDWKKSGGGELTIAIRPQK